MEPEKLKMHVNNLLFAEMEIEYSGMRTPLERMQHQERLAAEMLNENWHLLKELRGIEVLFFVEPVASRLNEFKI